MPLSRPERPTSPPTSRPARLAGSRSGASAWKRAPARRALLLAATFAATALAQPTRDPRVRSSERRRWGRATVRVTSHATYGVLVQVEAPDLGTRAFATHKAHKAHKAHIASHHPTS